MLLLYNAMCERAHNPLVYCLKDKSCAGNKRRRRKGKKNSASLTNAPRLRINRHRRSASKSSPPRSPSSSSSNSSSSLSCCRWWAANVNYKSKIRAQASRFIFILSPKSHPRNKLRIFQAFVLLCLLGIPGERLVDFLSVSHGCMCTGRRMS